METLRETDRRAGKAHRCGLCLGVIHRGDWHHVQTNVYDGRVYDWRTCRHCLRDHVITYVWDWSGGYYDEGVDYESAMEWAPDAAQWSKDGAERWAARSFLARCSDGEGE